MIQKSVVTHPLVLLSAVDHYRRMSSKRVMGVLLGHDDGNIHITNSFAIPFEEDGENWFYDTSYLQSMYELFHKVDSKETIMGWYHTGPKMSKNDLEITKSMSKFCENPYLAIINVHSTDYDLPVKIYKLNKQNEFVHVNSLIEAEEAEEVGVEHLIRDIREECSGSLKDTVNIYKESFKVYKSVISNIIQYLDDVITSKLAYNHEIIDLLQEALNSIPHLNKSLDKETCNLYTCELIKTVIGMNDLKKNRKENEVSDV